MAKTRIDYFLCCTLYAKLCRAPSMVLILLALLCGTPMAHATAVQGELLGKIQSYMVQNDSETLADIAERLQLGYTDMVAANPKIDPLKPGEGTELVLPTQFILPDAPHKGILINLGELRLYYFKPDGQVITMPIGIGREGLNTPLGTTTIVRKQAAPSWRPTPRMLQENPELPAEVKTGPDNPLGKYALYLGWPSYLMHGTNKPQAVGRRASSGCMRLYDDHVAWLFNNIPAGTPVRAVQQPIKLAWDGGKLYLEAQPEGIQIDEIEFDNAVKSVIVPQGVMKQIRTAAGKKAHLIDWQLVRHLLITRNGVPTPIIGGGKNS